MLVMTALVGLGVSVQVAGTPSRARRSAQQRAAFWPLWLMTLGAMNALFLSADLFNLYVTFEILGLAAVGLTALSGTRTALRATFDYLCAGLAGSLLLLLRPAWRLAYAAAGRVDVEVVPTLVTSIEGRIALGLIFAGLAVKAALFSLHFSMPAAHASAAPAERASVGARREGGDLRGAEAVDRGRRSGGSAARRPCSRRCRCDTVGRLARPAG